jgi:hypothetical protein
MRQYAIVDTIFSRTERNFFNKEKEIDTIIELWRSEEGEYPTIEDKNTAVEQALERRAATLDVLAGIALEQTDYIEVTKQLRLGLGSLSITFGKVVEVIDLPTGA